MLLAAALALLTGDPAVSELGIKVGAGGLMELKGKVTSREDAACREARSDVTLCVIGDGGEVYQFTEEGHPAHPSGYFLGYAERDGTIQLEERGWTASEDASAFFAGARKAEPKPTR